jgi:hypothetical protein
MCYYTTHGWPEGQKLRVVWCNCTAVLVMSLDTSLEKAAFDSTSGMCTGGKGWSCVPR